MTHGDNPPVTAALRPADLGIGWLWSAVSDALIAGDIDTGRIILWNPGAEQIFGYTRDEAIGLPIEMLMPERIRDRHRQGLARYRAGEPGRLIGGRASVEVPALTRAGDEIIVELVLLPVERTEWGRLVVAMARDITRRRQAEDALRDREAQLAEAQQIAHIGSWEWDIDSNAIQWSQELCEIYGVDASGPAITYDAYLERIHPDDRPHLQSAVRHAAQAQVPYVIEHRVVRPDGSIRFLEGRGRVVVDENGRPVRMFGTAQDITERKRTEDELAQRAQELARSNSDLEQFAYVASHDLQEPLRAVVSYLQLLEKRYRGQLDERADKYIDYAVDGAHRMQALINDLLAYSRVGRHHAAGSIDSEIALRHALANLEAAISESDATVTHDPLPRVTADAGELTQLFQNLISNAIKFRGEHTPQVHVSAAWHEDSDVSEWRFSVRDNGIGIEPAYQERIFVIFQRLHARSEYAGTGIGLAICQKIVERHGGRLWVDSTPGQGSTFWFTLPQIDIDTGGTE